MVVARLALGYVAGLWSLEAAHKLTWELPAPRIGASPSPPSKVVTRMLLQARGALSTQRCAMEPLIDRCCGLDVHKKTVTACVRVPGANGAR